jgi:hypothetical protein
MAPEKLREACLAERYRETEAWIDTFLARLPQEGIEVLSQSLESGLRDAMFRDARSLV